MKLPELGAPEGNGVRGPALVGAVCAAFTAEPGRALPDPLLEPNRLTPFALDCLLAGAAASVDFALA